jgi:hypothetical protein
MYTLQEQNHMLTSLRTALSTLTTLPEHISKSSRQNMPELIYELNSLPSAVLKNIIRQIEEGDSLFPSGTVQLFLPCIHYLLCLLLVKYAPVR